jgi:hypothetical protein
VDLGLAADVRLAPRLLTGLRFFFRRGVGRVAELGHLLGQLAQALLALGDGLGVAVAGLEGLQLLLLLARQRAEEAHLLPRRSLDHAAHGGRRKVDLRTSTPRFGKRQSSCVIDMMQMMQCGSRWH